MCQVCIGVKFSRVNYIPIACREEVTEWYCQMTKDRLPSFEDLEHFFTPLESQLQTCHLRSFFLIIHQIKISPWQLREGMRSQEAARGTELITRLPQQAGGLGRRCASKC